MAELLSAYDWGSHPLGAMDAWPASLKITLRTVLNSAFPMFIAWSDELYLLYNDAYRKLLGGKGDLALGRRFNDVWPEVIDELLPVLKDTLEGKSHFYENYPGRLERNGFSELAYFTFAYSPVEDESGSVVGLLCICMETTDKVRAFEKHRDAVDQLTFSLEASENIGTWSYDLEAGVTQVDARFSRLFQLNDGCSKTGMGLERLTELIHVDDRSRVLASIADTIDHGAPYNIEYRISQPSGRDVWVNARGRVFVDSITLRRRFAGVAVDISEVKYAQIARDEAARIAKLESQRSAENSRLLKALLDSAPVGIVFVDSFGKLIIANATNREIWGEHPTPEELSDYSHWKGWWGPGTEREGELINADEWPLSVVLMGESVAECIAEIEPFGQAGTRRTIAIRAAVVRDEAGGVVGAVAANMDITAQVAAERAFADSEQRLRSVNDVIPQIVWSANAEGINDYVNTRWAEFTGEPNNGVLNDDWARFIHDDDLQELSVAWNRSLQTGVTLEIEHRLLHHTGEYRWVLNRALPIYDEFNRIKRWMGTLTDVHDRKIAEQSLRVASRKKDEFLAMLAHELRNPLAPIVMAAEVLQFKADDPEQVKRSSAVLSRQVRHMTTLIDDLLDVSRVTRGLVELELKSVDLNGVIASAIEQVRPLVESRRHTLQVNVSSGASWVSGDRTRLTQILANLLNNAAKYTQQGGMISLDAVCDGGVAKICVIDNGIGISPELLPHVFELFTQAERTPDRMQGGLGLGLALVRSLAALQGGSVTADSKGIGQGSTFCVRLPLAAEGRSELAQGKHASEPARERLSVLVVDDNLDAAQSLSDALRSVGHDVRVSEHPMDALEQLADGWPDVFVLDIGLPEMDGYELVRHLISHNRGRRTLYIALTGYGQSHDKVLSKGAGFHHHLVKPVDFESLLRAINAFAAGD